jgi:hypothetical protein
MFVIIAESDYNSIRTIDFDEVFAAQIEVQSAVPNAWGPKSTKVLVTVYKEDPAILGSKSCDVFMSSTGTGTNMTSRSRVAMQYVIFFLNLA